MSPSPLPQHAEAGAGASAELRGLSYTQPSVAVSADSTGKRYRDAFDDEVAIIRVEYADGDEWGRGNRPARGLTPARRLEMS